MSTFQSLVDLIRANSTIKKKGITFVKSAKEDRFISYAELYKKALRILHILQVKGIQPGEELVFQIEDNEQFLILFWGCILGKIIHLKWNE